MITPGLLSVTFRKLTPRAIIDLAREAGLRDLEWGGDVHVPHGKLDRARDVRRETEEAGLRVAAYGSYYRLVKSEADGLSFDRVLETAVELGAPTIRVWAGAGGSATTSDADRQAVVAESKRIADAAEVAALTVSYEFHAGTLTDTNASARRLLEEVNHPNLFTYWQPATEMSVAERCTGLKQLLPRVTHLHVYHWTGAKHERRPLAEGAQDWRQYLALARSTGRDHSAMLEFVQEDDPAAFRRDAATLKEWLA